jgi:hypothetical protein
MECRSCCTETEGIYCELYTKAVEYYAMIAEYDLSPLLRRLLNLYRNASNSHWGISFLVCILVPSMDTAQKF